MKTEIRCDGCYNDTWEISQGGIAYGETSVVILSEIKCSNCGSKLPAQVRLNAKKNSLPKSRLKIYVQTQTATRSK